jgi:hypothetical protein
MDEVKGLDTIAFCEFLIRADCCKFLTCLFSALEISAIKYVITVRPIYFYHQSIRIYALYDIMWIVQKERTHLQLHYCFKELCGLLQVLLLALEGYQCYE